MVTKSFLFELQVPWAVSHQQVLLVCGTQCHKDLKIQDPPGKSARQDHTFFRVLQVACTGVVTCSKMAIFCNCKQRRCPCISFLPLLSRSEKQ